MIVNVVDYFSFFSLENECVPPLEDMTEMVQKIQAVKLTASVKTNIIHEKSNEQMEHMNTTVKVK